MEDFIDIDKCSTISELLDAETDCKKENIDEKFDSLYEKANSDNFEAIVSVNNLTKTAVITPIVRKKYLVDYESSDTDYEDIQKEDMTTPHPTVASKTPKLKRQRAATPHISKYLNFKRQNVMEVNEEINEDDYSAIDSRTPLRNDNIGGKLYSSLYPGYVFIWWKDDNTLRFLLSTQFLRHCLSSSANQRCTLSSYESKGIKIGIEPTTVPLTIRLCVIAPQTLYL